MKIKKCPKCGKYPKTKPDNGWHGTRSYTCCGLKAFFGKESRYYVIKDWNAMVMAYKKRPPKYSDKRWLKAYWKKTYVGWPKKIALNKQSTVAKNGTVRKKAHD